MKRTVPFLVLVVLVLCGCGEVPGGAGDTAISGRASFDDFCGTALARVDSFMATLEGREWDEGRYGGMAVVGTGAAMHGMSPWAAGNMGSAQHQMFVNLMTLIQYDEDLAPIPYLAREWDLSEDGTELTFYLRDDVYWHDGRLTTAHDVEFTYLTLMDPASDFSNQAFFQRYETGEAGVEVVDSFTVRFHMEPHADVMDPWRVVAVLPRHLLGDVPREDLTNHPFAAVCPVGNGPFRFFSHSPGSGWVFEANPAFPEGLGGRPFLDRYVYREIPDRTTLQIEFLTGGVDVYVQMLPEQMAAAVEHPDLRVEAFPYRSVFLAAWNGRIPKLSDVRVRRALTLGINRRQIIDAARPGSALVNSGVPPTHWAFDPALGDESPYDPSLARALLDDAGWVDRNGDGVRENAQGAPLEIDLVLNVNTEFERVAEIMRGHLGDIGVRLRPQVMEFGAFLDVIFSPERAFEGALISFETEFRLDEWDQFHSEAVGGDMSFSGLADEELDRYLDTLQIIPDRSEALATWEAYQRRIMELQPYTFLYSGIRTDGINRRIRDAVFDARGEWASLRYWWIAPEDRTVR